MDKKIADLITMFEADGSDCMLDHYEKHKAVTCLRQEFDGGGITIPICEQCVAALCHKDWILLFCLECCESMWIYKPQAKHPYLYKNLKDTIMWLHECPNCYKGGTNGKG